MFLAYVSPLGRSLVDKRLYLPESWTSDEDRCAAAGIPGERRSYRSKTGLALEMLERAVELGHLRAGLGRGRRRLRRVAVLPQRVGDLGNALRPGTFQRPLQCGRWSPSGPLRSTGDGVGPPKPRLVAGQRRTMGERSGELPEDAWQEITVAQGSQGPRSYTFSAQRGAAQQQKEARRNTTGPVYRRNLDGSEPRYYLSNAPEDTPVGDPGIRGRFQVEHRNGV